MRSFSIALLVFFAMACLGHAAPSQQQTVTTQDMPNALVTVSGKDIASHQSVRDMHLKAEWAMQEAEKTLGTAKWTIDHAQDEHASLIYQLQLLIAVISVIAIFIALWAGNVIRKSDNIIGKHKKSIEDFDKNSKYIKEFESISESVTFDNRTASKLSKKNKEKIKKVAVLTAPLAAAALASIKMDWDDASFLWKQVLRASPENKQAKIHLAHTLNQSGLALYKLAEDEPGFFHKQRLLGNSCDKYEKATKIDGKMFNTWGNWGDSLQKLAETFGTDASRRKELLEEACDKYEKATTSDKKRDKSWNNWGDCLEKLAALDPSRRRKLLEGACSKYQEAVALRPNYKVYSNNLNQCMGELDKFVV